MYNFIKQTLPAVSLVSPDLSPVNRKMILSSAVLAPFDKARNNNQNTVLRTKED